MAQLLKTILILASILIASCSNQKDPCNNMTSKQVCVTIINQSGHDIKSLLLIHERGEKDIGALANNSKTSVVFTSPGENSYILTVILDSGDTIKSTGTYSEGGYRITETISSNSINTAFDKY